MSKVCCALEFEKVFDEWVHNHFYEPDYRKEPDMKKPAHRHIDALTRAQNLLETGVEVHDNPRLKKSIEDDILLLGEIRDIFYDIIDKPDLPFAQFPKQCRLGGPCPIDEKLEPVLNPIEDEPNEAD